MKCNKVMSKICCWSKFSATMASRFSFVAADEEFIEETQKWEQKTQKNTDYWTKIFQQWAKMRGKN